VKARGALREARSKTIWTRITRLFRLAPMKSSSKALALMTHLKIINQREMPLFSAGQRAQSSQRRPPLKPKSNRQSSAVGRPMWVPAAPGKREGVKKIKVKTNLDTDERGLHGFFRLRRVKQGQDLYLSPSSQRTQRLSHRSLRSDN